MARCCLHRWRHSHRALRSARARLAQVDQRGRARWATRPGRAAQAPGSRRGLGGSSTRGTPRHQAERQTRGHGCVDGQSRPHACRCGLRHGGSSPKAPSLVRADGVSSGQDQRPTARPADSALPDALLTRLAHRLGLLDRLQLLKREDSEHVCARSRLREGRLGLCVGDRLRCRAHLSLVDRYHGQHCALGSPTAAGVARAGPVAAQWPLAAGPLRRRHGAPTRSSTTPAPSDTA